MKKILAILGLAAVTTGLHAQGLVTFYSFSGTIKTNTTAYVIGATPAGTSGAISGATANSFYFTVLISSGATSTDASSGVWTQALHNGTGLIGSNYVGLNGDMQGPNGTQSTSIDNWSAGATESYMIVGWSASLGSTWSQVQQELSTGSWIANGFFGTSSIASGASGTPPTGTPLSLFTGTGTFSMYSVTAASTPEPGTIALAGLGIAGLLALRRKK